MSCETSSQIHDAIKVSKYNEAVILTIDDESDENSMAGGREIVLIPSLDVENGGVMWNSASSTSAPDQEIGISRHLRTKKWVMPMLNDSLRNVLYDRSIRRACNDITTKVIQKLKSSREEEQAERGEEPAIRVLDIGSGTGLLAMIAARSLKEILTESESLRTIQITVQSIEMASAMVRLARKTISENNLGKTINVMEGHSCDYNVRPFEGLAEKAQLCTSELLESGLLGEGLIPAMRDAWDRHLEEGAIVIPQKARVYAQVIESNWVTQFRSSKMNFKNLCLSPKSGGVEQLLSGNVLVPIHAEGVLGYDSSAASDFFIGMSPRDNDSIEAAKFLSDSAVVLEFDFTSKESIPSKCGRSIRKEFTATNRGFAHAILFWWELDLFGETYSTKVGGNWQDHWQQCVYVFSAADSLFLEKDEAFILLAKHDDSSISFELEKECEKEYSKKPKKQKVTHEVLHHISCERALQLNDKERMKNLCDAIKTALSIKGESSYVLDVSDFSLCSLIASVEFDAKNVTSIENSSTDNIAMLSALVSQIGNNLPKDGCCFQIVQAHFDSLTLSNLQKDEAFDVVLAEPYYDIMQSWCIATALNYHYIIKSLKRRMLLKPDAISVPSFATIKCCAVEFHTDVIKAHCGLSMESLCGLSHESVKSYAENFSKYDMTFPLWQYEWKRLSDDYSIAKILYEGPLENMDMVDDDANWTEIQFSHSGICHCVVFWVDYSVRINQGDGTTHNYKTMTTGNRHHQQTVKMLESPKVITEHDIGSFKLLVRPRFKRTPGINEDDYSLDIKTS